MNPFKIQALPILLSLTLSTCLIEEKTSETLKTTKTSFLPRSHPDTKINSNMTYIPEGPFLFGVTEHQFQYYLSQIKFNFPGMVNKLRKDFTIPPKEIFELPFYISFFEITNREYKTFINSSSYIPSSRKNYLKHWKNGSYPEWSADFPVVWVSQSDALAYCHWINGDLPTETQWEKTARGPSDVRGFPWGNEEPSPSRANYSSKQLEPVGDRPGDISPFKVFDLGGNAAEHTKSKKPGLTTQSVIRGGSFLGNSQYTLIGVRLRQAKKNQRFEDVGFRCVSY